jgi:hypothetical protein
VVIGLWKARVRLLTLRNQDYVDFTSQGKNNTVLKADWMVKKVPVEPLAAQHDMIKGD